MTIESMGDIQKHMWLIDEASQADPQFALPFQADAMQLLNGDTDRDNDESESGGGDWSGGGGVQLNPLHVGGGAGGAGGGGGGAGVLGAVPSHRRPKLGQQGDSTRGLARMSEQGAPIYSAAKALKRLSTIRLAALFIQQ